MTATFPQAILDTRVELLLGGVWTNVTTYVYQRDQVSIERGHPDEATTATPSAGALTLNNRDARFSPYNPVGPYYGQIGRNTPLRISVPEGSSYLRSEVDTASYASCPSSSGVNITGDIDVQVEATLDNWFTATLLAAKYDSTSNQRSWALLLNADSTLAFTWSTDGTSTNAKRITSTVPVPLLALNHGAVRATLAVATGTVTFYTAATVAGPWTQLGSTSVQGATSIFASTAAVTVGYNATWAGAGVPGFQGKIQAMKLLSGIGGTTKANPNFTTQTAGATSFADAQGNTWTLAGNAEISDRKYRMHGEVPSWPPRRDTTNRDVFTPIQPAGLMRRLGQGTPPQYSALYRAYVRATGLSISGEPLTPLAYWPCEDGSSSTSIGAAIGPTAMTLSSLPSFASNSDFVCSQPIPAVNGSTWTGAVPAASGTQTTNALKFLLAVPSGGDTNNGVIARMYTNGTIARLDAVYTTGGNLTITAYNAAGAQLATTGAGGPGVDGKLLFCMLFVSKSGTSVSFDFNYTDLSAPTAEGSYGGTVASASVGIVTQVQINPGGLLTGTAVGHVVVTDANDIGNYIGASSPITAWTGEAAGSRFARLCTEEGVTARVRGSLTDTVLMGPQPAKDFLSLLQEVEDADRGLIFEPRQCLGLGYRTRVSMLNQPAAVTLSFTSAHLSDPLEPTDDDLLTVNDITVQREGGSSMRQTLASGAMSTQPPPNGIGLYDSAVTVNLASDGQALSDETGWLLHLGTVNELRYPRIAVNLARSELASQFYALQDVDVGDRIVVTNTPADLPPDGISQIVRGGSEVCFGFTFTLDWVCAPESPYHVAVFDDPVLGRADIDGSTLTAGITSTATSMQVTITDLTKPLWTTSAGDFPFDIAVGGERMTVTNITGSSSPQTMTVTRSVNGVVKAQTAGTDVRLFQPAILSM